MGQDTPYVRLSAFYLFYFASIGAFVPYWSVYLQSLAFTPQQIGELIAISLLTKVIAPYLWGWLADHLGRRLSIIRWTAFVAALSFTAILFEKNYWGLAAILSIYSFFWHAGLPQFEAVTLNHLGARRTRYARIRLWGSVGFIATVVGLGYWFDRVGVSPLPFVLLGLLVAIWAVTLLTPDKSELHTEQTAGPILATLSRTPVIMFLVAAFLLQMSHGPYYTFLSIYLQDHGYSATEVGQLWAVGVIAEIGVFLAVHRWLAQFGAIRLFRIALLITTVRWILLADYVDTLWILLIVQTMHAASYGLFHAAAIELVHHFFPGRLQGRGQALYSSLSFGLGNALGSWAAGHLWTQIGPQATYLSAASVCFASFVVSIAGLRSRSVKL